MNKCFLKPGDVFCRIIIRGFGIKDKKEYWKVLSIADHVFMGESYKVVKCSATGKEFKQTNGFSVDIDRYFNEPEKYKDSSVQYRRVAPSSVTGGKANIDKGISEGKKKRRIAYLTNRIKGDSLELDRLTRGNLT